MFSNLASCSEIPDAIGWSSGHGSTVVECKVSLSDFYADQSKCKMWKHPHGWRYPYKRFSDAYAKEHGYELVITPSMGDYRFYLCPKGLLSDELVAKRAPDHGLLWLQGRSIFVIRQATKRESVDKDGEIRYLRFAIINGKTPHVNEKLEPQQLVLAAVAESENKPLFCQKPSSTKEDHG